MTTEQMLIVAIVSLAGVVGVLFGIVHKNYNECKEDRKRMEKRIVILEQALIISSCKDKTCGNRKRLTETELAELTLEQLNKTANA